MSPFCSLMSLYVFLSLGGCCTATMVLEAN